MVAYPIRVPDARVGPGVSDLVLSRIGGGEPYSFTAVSPRLSWEVSNTGQASFDLPFSEVLEYFSYDGGGMDRLRGRWVAFDGVEGCAWGGIIVDVRPRTRDGMVEVAARSWSENLNARRVPKIARDLTGTAGALIMRILGDAETDDDTLWLASRQADEVGEMLALQLRGEKILDLFRRMTQRTGQEWRVDEDRNLEWRQRIGTDLGSSVQVVEGVHAIEITPAYSLEPVRNDIFATPADARYEFSRGQIVEDADSIAEVGRRQERIAYAGNVTKSTLLPVAKAELSRLSRKGIAYTVQIVNVDGIWAQFREGDTIRVVSTSLNTAFDLWVRVRSLDMDGGILTVSGVRP